MPWLPVVLALSANSPWYSGELTGMASNRAPVLAELPRAGAPPAFASYAEWESWVERLVRLGVAEDYTRIWWDVRPHPKLGTLEIRVPDQPTDVGLSSAFTALVQALCATVLQGTPLSDDSWLVTAARRLRPEPLVGGTLRAARGAAAPGRLVVRARVAARRRAARAGPACGARLGSESYLDRFDPAACEADLQVQSATPQDATADIVARSLG